MIDVVVLAEDDRVTNPESQPTPSAPVPSGKRSFFDRLSERQMTLLVIAVGLLLYIPLAGTYGLWDPWETHYSEVARQMTKRGDFISLWWPGSPRDADVFWSKPVLSFWVMSIGMHIARIGLPGNPPGEMALLSRTEWAVRVPFCLFGVLAMWGIYMVVARFVSRRAGFLSALVMATSPMFALIARQAMTDMAFVGPMTMALALGTMALLDDRDDVLPRKGRGFWSYPHHASFYTTVGVFLVLMVPQLIIDSVQLKVKVPIGGHEVLMYGAVAMIPYYLGSLLFLWFCMRARYRAPLYLYIAAMLCGVAVLAKGLAGAGLPIIIFLAYLLFTWNWKRLQRAQLLPAVAVSALVMVVVAAPWHHAMIIRHGWAFWNELFGDNHWRRMMLGRHGDRGTFEYFLRELGYGVLPWVALAPAALTGMVMRKVGSEQKQAVYRLGAIWFVAGYALVSLSMTKFHHYVLPAIPGLAIVIGCFINDVLEKQDVRRTRLAALVGIPLLAVIFADLLHARNAAQRFLWLFSYDYVHSPTGRPWPSRARLSHTARGDGRAHRPDDTGSRLEEAAASGGHRALPGLGGLYLLSPRRVHARGRAFLVAEGNPGRVLPPSPIARREAARLFHVLAGRNLLLRKRDLRRAQGRADRVRPGRRRRSDEGMDRQPPRTARVHHLRKG